MMLSSQMDIVNLKNMRKDDIARLSEIQKTQDVKNI